MNEIIKLGLILMIFTAVATSILALTYNYTNPIIQEKRGAEIKESLSNVFPEADDFRKSDENKFNAYLGDTKIGEVTIKTTKGYSSDIEIMVGTDSENKITGIKILSQLETPGLGSKIQEPWFQDQFIGKSASQIQLKKYGGEIDAVTSATISSNAVTKAVRKTIG